MSATRAAIVTGGASGIGAACVRRFLKDGIAVVAVDLNEQLIREMETKLNNPNFQRDIEYENFDYNIIKACSQSIMIQHTLMNQVKLFGHCP